METARSWSGLATPSFQRQRSHRLPSSLRATAKLSRRQSWRKGGNQAVVVPVTTQRSTGMTSRKGSFNIKQFSFKIEVVGLYSIVANDVAAIQLI
jgi:hypothetical protein